jgi:similar to spore coat protein
MAKEMKATETNKGYYHPTNVQEQLRVDMQTAQQVLQSAGR